MGLPAALGTPAPVTTSQQHRKGTTMYLGLGGILVLILIIVLIVFLVRRGR